MEGQFLRRRCSVSVKSFDDGLTYRGYFFFFVSCFVVFVFLVRRREGGGGEGEEEGVIVFFALCFFCFIITFIFGWFVGALFFFAVFLGFC